MSRFNLISEPWISVIADKSGKTKKVSLAELFDNAHNYYGISGDTKSQDFSVMRLLLAIIHTVYTRVDENGNGYPYFNLSPKYEQLTKVDEYELEEYTNDLISTWTNLWESKKFSSSINEYLEKWSDRFYLFDDKYPFYQVRAEDISSDKISKSTPSEILGKNINRTISESGNKIAMFSPKFDSGNNKNILTADEVARWLITYQGYCGLSDKVIFGTEKYKVSNSKGWLYDIGAITLKGDNLFETLMLNFVIVHPRDEYWGYTQKPCWELGPSEIIKNYLNLNSVDNIAELYTNWSRAIYIDPEFDLNKAFKFNIVKIPEIEHKNMFLEPMTMWRYNTNGENKDNFTPRKHRINQAIWRSYGLIALDLNPTDNKVSAPIIMQWLSAINDIIGNRRISVEAIGMQDDGNATSWVPVDQIYDHLNIYNNLLIDIDAEGWIYRINDIIDQTKKVVEYIYKKFISDIAEIRNLSNKSSFVIRNVENLYYDLDHDFRTWISGIKPEDSKEEKMKKWQKILKDTVSKSADNIFRQSGPRDYSGKIIETNNKNRIKNIATVYNEFKIFLNKEL